jgi:hypothetical protein
MRGKEACPGKSGRPYLKYRLKQKKKKKDLSSKVYNGQRRTQGPIRPVSKGAGEQALTALFIPIHSSPGFFSVPGLSWPLKAILSACNTVPLFTAEASSFSLFLDVCPSCLVT